MNRAQKNAWVGLIGGLVSIIIISIIGYGLVTGFPSEKCWLWRSTAVLAIAFFFVFIFAYSRKKKTNEPEADERDKQISLNAVRICLISVFFLICLSDAAIMVITGLDGWIPSCALPPIHFGMAYVGLTIYYVAVIILYGKDNKDIEGGAA